jgi:hypothetical protein
MSFLGNAKDRKAAHEALADALALLRQDPRRFKALLRSVASLVEDLSVVLGDAAHAPEAKKVRRLSQVLRATALLPASASTALARKLLDKAFAPKG